MDNIDIDDIMVLICHPQVDIWMPLREWIQRGSGSRKMIRPIAAKHTHTGEPLPLPAIPLAVRNDPEAWEAVRLGWIQDPDWPNEHYSAKLDRVDPEEGTIAVTTGTGPRTLTIADDTELVLLQGFDLRPMKDRLHDENLQPGADVIVITKRTADKEIVFQLQLLVREEECVASGRAAEPMR